MFALAIGLLVLVAVIIATLIGIYNRIVAQRNRAEQSWAQIDVQLRRRYDLIPNLVETVKGYAAHERETLEGVTQARAAMDNAGTVEERAQADNILTGALRSLFAVAEAYPNLKADQNFMDLQQQLQQLEQEIATSREVYNEAVMTFNTLIQVFPNSVIASFMSARPLPYYRIEEPEAREPVRVQF
jgi:LemA protein